MTKTALLVGASGRFSQNMANVLTSAGWTVRPFNRATQNMAQEAEGVDVIVNGANPPYPLWKRDTLPLTKDVISAAKASGATILMPGNVYVFGKKMPSVLSETTPHNGGGELSQIRIEMEQLYRESGVQTILLRAGDFLDTRPSGNWFDLVMTTKLAKGQLIYPGNTQIPHAWAYLPDMAQAAVLLIEKRQDLSLFEDVPFPGYALSGQQLANQLSTVMGKQETLKRFAWWQMHLARPVWPLARYLLEMRYLWETPHQLDSNRFCQLLPQFEATPLPEALAHSIGHIKGGSRKSAGKSAAQPSRAKTI